MFNFKSKLIKKITLSYLLVFFILFVFLGGVYLGAKNETTPAEKAAAVGGKVIGKESEIPDYLKRDVNFNLFWEVWDYLKNNYVDDNVMDTKLFYGALAGVVAGLQDPYSVFLEPETSKKFQQELSGSFEGIGAEIGLRDDTLTIIAPLPGNPAEIAGLLAGDKVLAIDDYDTTGMSLDYAVNLIRGPKGTTVKLTILHNGDSVPTEVHVVRDTIKIVSVSWKMLDNQIAKIDLKYFHEDTLTRFNTAVREIIAQQPRGIILDLRNNPGGFLQTAVEITANWVGADKIIVIEKRRNEDFFGHQAAGSIAYFQDIPTVVLINKGSASGSEIVAGALQDYKAATLVGETTFGKGSVQELKALEDGSSVKLTIAKWLTPAGREIDQEGIAPDVEVKLVKEDYDKDLDPQLDKALEILR